MNTSFTLEKVLEKIRPTEEELSEAKELYSNVRDLVLKTLNIEYPFIVELEGSVAKGTALRGEIDLDIFILIKHDEMTNEWLRNNVIDPLLKAFKDMYFVQLRYASHPYIRIMHRGIEADVVPAYWANDPLSIKTAVDRTPFHTRYVKQHLKEEQKDEVRLLKKFFKGIGVYGAEIKVQGFSGYLCELLIIKYGDFMETLKNISQWRAGTVVRIEQLDETDKVLRIMFQNPPLIVPDPVDPRRNTAAAVSKQSLTTAVIASSLFLKYPKETFFFPPKLKVSFNTLAKFLQKSDRETVFLVYKIRNQVSPDVLWGELKSISRKLRNILTNRGFSVIDARIWSDESKMSLIMLDVLLPGRLTTYELRVGPKVMKSDNLMHFMMKYLSKSGVIGPWIGEDGKPYALVRREYIEPKQFLESLTRQEMISKDLELSMVTDDIRNLEHIEVNESKKDDFIHWLTEAVLKKPSWLGIDGVSSSLM